MVKVVMMSSLFACVSAHGAMTHPRPRNAFSSPGTNPSSGADWSCKGDACFWYQIGCHIGCPSCTLTGKTLYPTPHCSKSDGLMEPTNNDPEFRTWDPHGQSDCGDFTKYNPWRAPGKAPVVDPCGVAGGAVNPGPQVEIPEGYAATAKGSEVLPEQAPTHWQAGTTAQVGWGLSAQHGGGYSYRLCPKKSRMSEDCFQRNVLTFAGSNSTIHYNDGSKADIAIPAKTYLAPDGAQWRTNPIPGCACDIGLKCGGKEDTSISSEGSCVGQGHPHTSLYPQHGSASTSCRRGTMFETGTGFDDFSQGFLTGPANDFSVMDEINVPNTPGEYILSWRWDCEQTDQVWNSCADVVIAGGEVSV